MILTPEDIRSCVEPIDYVHGVTYYYDSKVQSYRVLNNDETNFKLSSYVQGSSGKVYEQSVKIVYTNKKFVLYGDCTCPVGYNCKHVVAACLAYVIKNRVPSAISMQSSSDTQLSKWLYTLQESAKPKSVNANEYFITYRLFDKVSRYGTVEFSIFKSKILKNKKLSQGTKLDEYKFFTNYGYSDIKKSEDDTIAMLLEGLRSNFRGTNGFFRERLGYMALLELLKTNRCYCGANEVPLHLSPTVYHPKFSWKKIKDKYSIESNITKEYQLLYTTPPLIIDTINSVVYEMSIEPKVLKELKNAPQISEEQLIQVYETIQKIAPNIELQTPKGIQTKTIQTQPTAYIKLFLPKEQMSIFHSMEVSFLYENHKQNYYPQEQKTSFLQEKIKTEILRDLQFEESVKQRLEEFGFVANSDATALFMLPSNYKTRQEQLQTWSEFLEFHMPSLESEGWHVEVDASFEMKFEQHANIVVESENTNDWFNLAFNLEFNGVSLSLVPLVSGIIAEFDDYENLPELINIEISQNSFVTLQTKQIAPILKTIFELLDKKEKDDSLKISAFDAHLIDNLDETVIWKGSREILELSKKLKNFEGMEVVVPPKFFTATLRDYQQEGVNWLNFLYEFKFGGILADDMGLGKTIQTLVHLSRLKEDGKLIKPSLIIMPTSLIANWKNEVKKFTPNLSVLSLHGSERAERFSEIANYDLILTTYPLIIRDKEKLDAQSFFYLILDEAQKIKNATAKMTVAIKTLKSEHRLALSGTPIENHLGELWSIFSFLMPGFLDSLNFFRNYYQTPIEKEHDFARQELLNKRIKPFMVRRTKEKVAHELPQKSEIIKYTEFDEKQSKLYESIRVMMEKKVREAVSKKGLGSSHITILDALLKLRQVCCDPSLLKIDEAKKVKESAKLELFLDLVDELLQEGRKILVFSQFTSMLAIIEEKIIEMGVKYTKLTGSTKNRPEAIEKFTKGDAQLFLISLKAGGVGLNLVEADTVIHYDPWWNPAVENQATDRAYRIGQTKAVFVYKLIVANSIEQKILELQHKKQSLQDGIYDNNKQQEEMKFSSDELLELLR